MDGNGDGSSDEIGWDTGNHYFVLSTSGKPVYSRHGSEDRLATISGVMQALVSFVQSSDDSIRSIKAGNTTIQFLVVEPLILVTVAREGKDAHELRQNLRHLHNQLLFIFTLSQLQKKYQERKNVDFRRLLAGSERLIDYLIDNLPVEPGFFLTAVPCLLMESKVRSNLAHSIAQVVRACGKMEKVAFGVLVADGRMVCQVRMPGCNLHPNDCLLILNLVASTESFKSGEAWSPLCLPQFNNSGFMYAYVSYLSDDCPACLLLLTNEKDVFYSLADAKQKLVERLRRSGNLDSLSTAQSKPLPTVSSLNIPQLRHFLYVLTDRPTYFWPQFQAPYDTKTAKEEIISAYRALHYRLTNDNLKVIFVRRNTECLLAWTRDYVQLFLVLAPTVTSDEASKLKNDVLAWIGKQEDLIMREDYVFN